MQCLVKYPKRHLTPSPQILHQVSTIMARNLSLLRCRPFDLRLGRTPCASLTASRNDRKLVRREYHAVRAILLRSGFKTSNDIARLLRVDEAPGTTSRPGDKRTASSGPDKTPPSQDNQDNPKKGGDDKMQSILFKYFMWFAFFWLIATTMPVFGAENVPREIVYISWNDFFNHMLSKGEVKELILQPQLDVVVVILHPDSIIKGQRGNAGIRYLMRVGDMDRFEEKLRNAEDKLNIKLEDRVAITYDRSPATAAQLTLLFLLLALLPFIVSRLRSMKPSLNFEGFRQMTRAKFTLVDPVKGAGKGVRFSDVAGLEEAKVEVMEFVDYLKNPDHYKTLGAKVPKGALLLGPPGCGKTLLAKAVATEANVPFLSMNGSEFIEMIGGLGAARVRDLFKEANSRAPCIVYVDEIDAIGKKRSSGMSDGGNASSESDQTLNQLLVEMDGMASKEGVIMLASTNRADVLDKALLRPGRFDRHILIDLPTMAERRQIFEHHLKGITLDQEPKFYSSRLAYLTPGFSGADIANVCNEAALHAARFKKKIVGSVDLEYAVERMVGGTEKRQHAMSLTEKRVVAYHEAGHALVGWMLEHTDALLKVTIVPRTSLALGFAQYTPTDQKLYTTEQLFERMCMALGGRVAESLTFNRITTGAQNDLDKVTKMAYSQIQQFGMNSKVGLISFDPEELSQQSRKPYSQRLANIMDVEARRLVNDVYKKTQEVLTSNKEKLEVLAEALLKRETLNYKDVVELIGPPPYGNKHLVEPAEFEASIKSTQETPESTPESSAESPPEPTPAPAR